MADYSDFQSNLVPWLKAVWANRIEILRGASSKGRTEGAWLVYDLYNDPSTQVARHWELFKSCIKQFNSKYLVTVAPQDGQWVEDDFYHMEPIGYDPAKSNDRIYCSVKGVYKGDDTFMTQWANALCIAYKVLELRSSIHGFQKLKVTGPGMSPIRHDNVVIWTTGPTATAKFVEQIRKDEIAQHLGFTTPPGTKEIRPGLATAAEPPETKRLHMLTEVWQSTQHSFGSYLAGCIFLGLEDWDKKYQASEEKFLERVLEAFALSGVDPMNTTQIDISSASLKHSQFLANMNIARSGSSGSLAVAGPLDSLRKKTGGE